jgi:large subunit ribosomal protein L9
MRVILLEDVKKVGKKGAIVDVSDGYGANFLIPRKLAVLATKTSLEIKKTQDDNKAKEEEIKKQNAIALKEKIKDYVVEIKAGTGKEGKLFGAVSSKEIVEEYKKQFNVELDKRKFIDFNPIGALGYTKIQVELYKDVIGTITVHVIEK